MSAQNIYFSQDDFYNMFDLSYQQEEKQQAFSNMDSFPSPSAYSNDTFQTEELQLQTGLFQNGYEQNQIQDVEPNQTQKLGLEDHPLGFDLKDLKFTPAELNILDQFIEYQADIENGCEQIGNQNQEPVDCAHFPAQSSPAHNQIEYYHGPGSNFSSYSESSQIFSIDSFQNAASADDRSVFNQPMSNSSQLSEASRETEFESPNSNYSTQSAGSASKPNPNEKYRNKKLTKISSTEKEIKRLAREKILNKKKINLIHAAIQALKDECLGLNINVSNISNYSLENLECDDEAVQEQEQQPTNENKTFRCEYCQLDFKSKRGVGIHKSSCKKH